MPELPEVETVRRGAEPLLQSKRLLRVQLRRDDLRWPIPVDNIRGLEGRECTAIERRSKYLLMRFDGTRSPIAIIHLGMSGRMLVDVTTARDERPEWRLHEHWRMDFGDRLVRFIDPRRFGMLDYSDAQDLERHKLIRVLGREPLEPGFDSAFLQSIRRGKKASIKSMLMDGRLIVGVGNIYASEACWRAKVRPRRAAASLKPAECDALCDSVRTVLQSAIDAGGTSFRDYVGVGEEQGYFARELAVYEREGLPCRRCKAKVRRTTDQGRSTYWCAGCQR
jgi:formamidopyrimidine-DNA glycosylase